MRNNNYSQTLEKSSDSCKTVSRGLAHPTDCKTVSPTKVGAHTEFATTRLLPLQKLGMDPGVRRDDGVEAICAASCGFSAQ